jgi:hypothetical protein
MMPEDIKLPDHLKRIEVEVRIDIETELAPTFVVKFEPGYRTDLSVPHLMEKLFQCLD